MKSDQYDVLVAKTLMGVPNWKDVEAIILSPAFQQIYQQVVLAAEARAISLSRVNLATPEGQHAASQTQGIVMGMRMALDMFISASEEKPDGR